MCTYMLTSNNIGCVNLLLTEGKCPPTGKTEESKVDVSMNVIYRMREMKKKLFTYI